MYNESIYPLPRSARMALSISHAAEAGPRQRRASVSAAGQMARSRMSFQGDHYVGSRYAPAALSKDADEKCTEAFAILDIDQSGRIDATELGRAFRLLDIEMPRTAQDRIVRAMLKYLDKDMDAEISLSEFKNLWAAYVLWKKKRDREAPRPPFLPPVSGNQKVPLSIFLIFDDPSSSCILAKMVSLVVILTIVVSTTTFVLETDLTFRTVRQAWPWWEAHRLCLGL